jgi:hypothetical protein
LVGIQSSYEARRPRHVALKFRPAAARCVADPLAIRENGIGFFGFSRRTTIASKTRVSALMVMRRVGSKSEPLEIEGPWLRTVQHCAQREAREAV